MQQRIGDEPVEADHVIGLGVAAQSVAGGVVRQVGVVEVEREPDTVGLALFPIRDTVVEKALGQSADPWWRALVGNPGRCPRHRGPH